jgi:hypothetical protein
VDSVAFPNGDVNERIARMNRSWHIIDRVAGKIYTRILAVITTVVSAAMLISAVIAWRTSGAVGGLVWLGGAVLFGAVARASWRSRAALSDVDTA